MSDEEGQHGAYLDGAKKSDRGGVEERKCARAYLSYYSSHVGGIATNQPQDAVILASQSNKFSSLKANLQVIREGEHDSRSEVGRD